MYVPTISMHDVIIEVFQLLTLVRAVWVSSASSDSCMVLKRGCVGTCVLPLQKRAEVGFGCATCDLWARRCSYYDANNKSCK